MGRVASHVACVAALLAAVLLASSALAGVSLPALVGATSEVPQARQGDVATSPSIILVNPAYHADDLDALLAFLSGTADPPTETDLTCLVAASDSAGLALADSLAGELGPGQMSVRVDDDFLVASLVGERLFDVMVMSETCADQLGLLDLAHEADLEVVQR